MFLFSGYVNLVDYSLLIIFISSVLFMLLQVQHDPKSKGVIEDIWNSGEVVPRVHEVESTSEVQR